MKFLVKDALEREYDVDAPEGTDINKVVQIAERRLGIKVRPVEKEAPPPPPEKDRGEIEAEQAHRRRVETDLEEARRSMSDERERASEALAEERARHEETHKARMKALNAAQSSVIETLQSVIEGERKAREAAEKRATDAVAQKAVVIENKIAENKPHTWRIEVQRDRSGFIVAMEATPKK